MTALRIERLGHAYGAARVLSDVSFAVEPGTCVAVLGASGSGKTTLLRSVAGFVTPAQGRIFVRGAVVVEDGRERVPAERRRVGMVFQDYALFAHMTVRENVEFGIHRDPDRAERVRGLLALVGLSELAGRRPTELSGGQQQRVALARALAPRPAVILLDEPFANLDAALRARLGEEVRDILRAAGVATLLVTHDRADALSLADRVAVLGGTPARLLQLDTPEAVYARPATRAVAALTGEVSFLSGTARGQVAETPLGPVALTAAAQGAVTLAVRPEQLRFDAGEGTSRVLSRRYFGPRSHLRVATPAGELGMDAADAPAPGTAGSVRVVGACAAVAD